ncbi:MAG: InlB B-repeat-containing protein [Solirubrobacteraceae bacterium]
MSFPRQVLSPKRGGFGVKDGAAGFEVCTSSCQVGILGSGTGQLSNPTAAANDGSGNVYAADLDNNRIEKFFVSHTLTVSRTGSGSGNVSSSPAGVDCGASCQYSFGAGTQVTLTATPAPGSSFAGWLGSGCAATGACRITLGQDTSVTASFNLLPPNRHTLAVHKLGNGKGTITSSPAGINCGVTCTTTFVAGQRVTLTATAASRSRFAGWSGACTTKSTTCTVALTADAAVSARFLAPPVISRLSISPTGFKAASSGPSTRPLSAHSKRGAVVRYTLSQAATVRFTIEQQLPGRKTGTGKHARCVAPTARNRKARRCIRIIHLRGSFGISGRPGANAFRLTGRFAGKTLPTGTYTLSATPTVGGLTGNTASVAFRVS